MTYRVFPNLKPPVWLYSPTQLEDQDDHLMWGHPNGI